MLSNLGQFPALAAPSRPHRAARPQGVNSPWLRETQARKGWQGGERPASTSAAAGGLGGADTHRRAAVRAAPMRHGARPGAPSTSLSQAHRLRSWLPTGARRGPQSFLRVLTGTCCSARPSHANTAHPWSWGLVPASPPPGPGPAQVGSTRPSLSAQTVPEASRKETEALAGGKTAVRCLPWVVGEGSMQTRPTTLKGSGTAHS